MSDLCVSHLDGDMTTARGQPGFLVPTVSLSSMTCCMTGVRKARVFPFPVSAATIDVLPDRTSGMATVWMYVGLDGEGGKLLAIFQLISLYPAQTSTVCTVAQ